MKNSLRGFIAVLIALVLLFPAYSVFATGGGGDNPTSGEQLKDCTEIDVDYTFKENVIEYEDIEASFKIDKEKQLLYPIEESEKAEVGFILLDWRTQRTFNIVEVLEDGDTGRYYKYEEAALDEVFSMLEIPEGTYKLTADSLVKRDNSDISELSVTTSSFDTEDGDVIRFSVRSINEAVLSPGYFDEYEMYGAGEGERDFEFDGDIDFVNPRLSLSYSVLKQKYDVKFSVDEVIVASLKGKKNVDFIEPQEKVICHYIIPLKIAYIDISLKICYGSSGTADVDIVVNQRMTLNTGIKGDLLAVVPKNGSPYFNYTNPVINVNGTAKANASAYVHAVPELSLYLLNFKLGSIYGTLGTKAIMSLEAKIENDMVVDVNFDVVAYARATGEALGFIKKDLYKNEWKVYHRHWRKKLSELWAVTKEGNLDIPQLLPPQLSLRGDGYSSQTGYFEIKSDYFPEAIPAGTGPKFKVNVQSMNDYDGDYIKLIEIKAEDGQVLASADVSALNTKVLTNYELPIAPSMVGHESRRVYLAVTNRREETFTTLPNLQYVYWRVNGQAGPLTARLEVIGEESTADHTYYQEYTPEEMPQGNGPRFRIVVRDLDTYFWQNDVIKTIAIKASNGQVLKTFNVEDQNRTSMTLEVPVAECMQGELYRELYVEAENIGRQKGVSTNQRITWIVDRKPTIQIVPLEGTQVGPTSYRYESEYRPKHFLTGTGTKFKVEINDADGQTKDIIETVEIRAGNSPAKTFNVSDQNSTSVLIEQYLADYMRDWTHDVNGKSFTVNVTNRRGVTYSQVVYIQWRCTSPYAGPNAPTMNLYLSGDTGPGGVVYAEDLPENMLPGAGPKLSIRVKDNDGYAGDCIDRILIKNEQHQIVKTLNTSALNSRDISIDVPLSELMGGSLTRSFYIEVTNRYKDNYSTHNNMRSVTWIVDRPVSISFIPVDGKVDGNEYYFYHDRLPGDTPSGTGPRYVLSVSDPDSESRDFIKTIRIYDMNWTLAQYDVSHLNTNELKLTNYVVDFIYLATHRTIAIEVENNRGKRYRTENMNVFWKHYNMPPSISLRIKPLQYGEKVYEDNVYENKTPDAMPAGTGPRFEIGISEPDTYLAEERLHTVKLLTAEGQLLKLYDLSDKSIHTFVIEEYIAEFMGGNLNREFKLEVTNFGGEVYVSNIVKVNWVVDRAPTLSFTPVGAEYDAGVYKYYSQYLPNEVPAGTGPIFRISANDLDELDTENIHKIEVVRLGGAVVKTLYTASQNSRNVTVEVPVAECLGHNITDSFHIVVTNKRGAKYYSSIRNIAWIVTQPTPVPDPMPEPSKPISFSVVEDPDMTEEIQGGYRVYFVRSPEEAEDGPQFLITIIPDLFIIGDENTLDKLVIYNLEGIAVKIIELGEITSNTELRLFIGECMSGKLSEVFHLEAIYKSGESIMLDESLLIEWVIGEKPGV